MSPDDHMDKKQVNKSTFDAACVFAGVSIAQLLVPWPLDYFLLPTAAAVWYVQSGQSSWLMDRAYQNSHVVADNLRHIARDVIVNKLMTNKKTTDEPIDSVHEKDVQE